MGGFLDACQRTRHLPGGYSRSLFDQHVAARCPRQADRAGGGDHPRRDLAAEIHRGVLAMSPAAPTVVIASGAKQSRDCPRRRSGLLRRFASRNDGGNRRNPNEEARAMAGASSKCRHLLQRPEPVVHVLVDLILGEAVALLQLAFELVAPALDDVEIVVGELAPFLLGGALELFPVSFDPVPIHCDLLLGCADGRSTGRSSNRSRRSETTGARRM